MDYTSESERYEDKINAAFTVLRGYLSSHASSHWKPLLAPAPETKVTNEGGAVNGISLPAAIAVHRRTAKRGDVVRAVADVPVGDKVDLDAFRAVLQTPEIRSQWDALVEKATVLDTLDAQTQLVKTDFRLGWPINPRDAVTISRTISDDSTVLHVATSLPRSPNEPSFLRPSPPCVRADIALFAWRLQLRTSSTSSQRTLRIHLFWQWSLKGSAMTSHYSQISGIVKGFVDHVRRRGVLLPVVTGFGKECDIVGSMYHRDRDTMVLDYRVLLDTGAPLHPRTRQEGLEELAAIKEARRLERAIEIRLPGSEGWDIEIATKGQGTDVDASYRLALERSSDSQSSYVTFRVTHAELLSSNQIVKASLTVSHLVGGSIYRINGETVSAQLVEARDPSSAYRQMLEDAATAANISMASHDSESVAEIRDGPEKPTSAALAKTNAIAGLIRRCYNYFTSLLQEPEQKWRPLLESKGVSVSQLTSLDPTLAIFRAEATFVGVSIWDLYSALMTPGARSSWDITNESVTLLDDLGESSSLWYVVTKAIWPSWARDAVLVRTSYRSPNSIHLFAFSTDDEELFPSVPKPHSSTIRSQVDVQGWCIESLSPTTTRISLIEQSDAKGWSMKSWTPQNMANMVAGLGEYTIKNGGPPMITRQLESKLVVLRYEQDKGALKAEYLPRRGKVREGAISPAILALEGDAALPPQQEPADAIECEIRCNVDNWAPDIDLVVDPPPAKISCLNRHRLSTEGGGLWITLEHEAALLGDNERVTVLVRKGAASREKGGVTVNGKRHKVEVERMGEDTMKTLAARKRVRAVPVPLDKAYKQNEAASSVPSPTLEKLPNAPVAVVPQIDAEAVVDQMPHHLPPLSQALEALAALQQFHAEEAHSPGTMSQGWLPTSTPHNFRRVYPALSPVHGIYRADKVIEKVSAEHLLAIITNVSSRATWDERVMSIQTLESFGHGFSLHCMTTKSAFLAFRPRIFFVASASAFVQLPSTSSSSSTSNVLFVAMASFAPDSSFAMSELNPQGMPSGNMLMDGWILESLDPYASDQHPIPSTRCSYFTSVDYAGSMPTSVSSMLNVNPLKVMESLERFTHNHRPPRSISPAVAVEALGSLSRDARAAVAADGKTRPFIWQLSGADNAVTQLQHDYVPSTRAFTSLLLITLKAPTRGRPKGSRAPTTASTPSTPLLNGRSSTPELRKQDSITALRNVAQKHKVTSSLQLQGSELALGSSRSQDVVLAEMVIYPHGAASSFAVTTEARFVKEDKPYSLSFEGEGQTDSVPIKAKMYPLPLDAVNASSLSPTGSGPSSLRPHLLRVYLAVAENTRMLKDPLQEGAAAPPNWLKRLESDSLLVLLTLVATSASTEQVDDLLRLILDGKPVETSQGEENVARKVVSGASDDDGPRPSGAQLSRVLAKHGDAEVLPRRLREPLAVSLFRQGRVNTVKTAARANAAVLPQVSRAPTPDQRAPSPAPLVKAAATDGDKQTMIKEAHGAAPPAISALVTSLSSLDVSSLASGPVFSQARFSLGFVILVAMAAFLLGSLLRALVGPTDFVLDIGREAAFDVRLLQTLHPNRNWRPARRLLEFRLPRGFLFGRQMEVMCASVDAFE